jgi:hypothetical protein
MPHGFLKFHVSSGSSPNCRRSPHKNSSKPANPQKFGAEAKASLAASVEMPAGFVGREFTALKMFSR